jgi:hypothetical protein
MGGKGRDHGIFDRGIGSAWALDIREQHTYPRYKMDIHRPVGEIKTDRAVTVRERLPEAPNTTVSAPGEARGRLEARIAEVKNDDN